ncbi:NADH-quinone oxidoreductase subunit NuoG [Anaplasma capra]|uniref:NADH-quinone oxidoreductase subunit NuoG n=1 Tax=Anaplasma capra TaxID=1562740 RepID=UPI0021D58E7E|nr:NADH-quinone oxidoreductase subunit NuoG [Anaplasma capra]MCU7611629.1 NADH-quinone oxidoreductase subunit NuoG [Anaplasma capra]
MVRVVVDSTEVEVEDGVTVLQACESAGVEIPRFCYHERLAIAGNCRMCLVEISGQPKLAASCAMPVSEGMEVSTNSEKVRKAREGVLELLLINHPLDCPICDQGGECDLQDQVMGYGRGIGRYDESKRAVSKKVFGPLIENSMNRCIHCTRCVRFLSDVAGTYEFGTFGRGENIEIDSCVEKGILSELSGNIVDLCPVGALTSKPYSFKARPWELSHCDTIDVLDAVCSNIRVDSRGLEVMRVLPRLNEDINEEWISDKTRFSCDGLGVQRLDRPYVRRGGKLVGVSWDEALSLVAKKFRSASPGKVAAVSGDITDCESMLLLKKLMLHHGSDTMDCRQDGAKLLPYPRSMYLFNTSISRIEEADLCLLVNANLRFDAPIINARMRKRYLSGDMVIATVGHDFEYTYAVKSLGRELKVLKDIYDGQHEFCKAIRAAKRPMIVLGQDALLSEDGGGVLLLAARIAEKFDMVQEGWNGFNVLHRAAARVGGLDIGFLPRDPSKVGVHEILRQASDGGFQVLYLLGADELDLKSLKKSSGALPFVIYQGHHADHGAHVADVVLPGAAYTEKRATYVNTEGRVQRTEVAIRSPGDSMEDWMILNALAERMGCGFGYGSVFDIWDELSSVGAQFKEENIGNLIAQEWSSPPESFELPAFEREFTAAKRNFYMTDPISRASATMAKCTRFFMDKAC